MRPDILQLDTTIAHKLEALELRLNDVESIRNLLSGGSVIDWHKLAFTEMAQVDRFLRLLLIDPDKPDGMERLRYVYNEAVSYLEVHLQMRIPKEIRNPDDIRHIFLLASDTRGFRRKQVLSCIVLKLVHVIHHMEAADLKFKAPISEEQLRILAEARLHESLKRLHDTGLPIVAVYGSRKSRSSTITKLIAKKDNLASTVFDKLRFRVVVKDREDILGVLTWLLRNVLPFNYVLPNQSHNNLIAPEEITALLKDDPAQLQEALVDEPELDEAAKNQFSGASYRTVNFIADYPVPLPEDAQPPGFPFELGQQVFVMVEFQIVDEHTATLNEEGENAHSLYKERQLGVVTRRLTRGLFES